MFDLAIKGDNILTPDGLTKGVVLIKDGLIVDLVTDPSINIEGNVEDVGDKVLMPGIIDPHVHINEPGRTEWEGFDTATRAAISGGVTTLVDMPLNSSPVTTTVAALEQKIAATNGKLHSNCGFWGGVIPGSEKEIEPLINAGVLGFKAFLIHSGIDEFPNVNRDDLEKAMPLIEAHALPLLVHCELDLGNTFMHSKEKERGLYNNYLLSRPREWENAAIDLMISLCEEHSCAVHIVHLSSSDSISQIKKAKNKGLPLTAETTQHFLFFNAEDIASGQTQFKCAPPIREKKNNDLLWDALQEKIIDFVATDHSPCSPELKHLESRDFFKAWGGIASIQFSLPALWTAAKKRGIALDKILKWLCENPAKIIAKQNQKGKIKKGFDADLVVWDPSRSFKVTEEIILHKHKITPYLGEQLFGVVEQTWLAGVKVFDNGKFLHLNRGRIILNQ